MTNEPSRVADTQGKGGTYYIKLRPDEPQTIIHVDGDGYRTQRGLAFTTVKSFNNFYPYAEWGRPIPSPDELERIEKLILRLQWIQFDLNRVAECASCGRTILEGHATGCEHVAALASLTSPQGDRSGR